MGKKITVRQLPNFINGKFVESGNTFDVLYPITGEVTAQAHIAGKAEVDAAVAAARAALDGPWGEMPQAERARWSVPSPTARGRPVVAGDAAHTVPPTGAKGLNLAINDVRILHECLVNAPGQGGGLDALDAYGPRALDRIWKSENFSYWMTQMLHTPAEGVGFDLKRQLGELNAVVSSSAGQTYLAESYTGWPGQKLASS